MSGNPSEQRPIKRKPFSLEDISRNLGISISTVSRALRNSPNIHRDTRQKVQEEAAKLGYRVRQREVEPATKSRNLLVLAVSMSTSSHQGYLSGISRAAAAQQISLFSHHCAFGAAEQVLDSGSQPAAMRLKGLLGIILVHRWPDEVASFLSRKWPVISLIHRYPDLPIDIVGTDDEANMQILVRHLRAQGHERIGFFGYNPAFSWARARYAAYLEVLMANGLKPALGAAIEVDTGILADSNPPDCSPYFGAVRTQIAAGVKAWISSSYVVAQGLCMVLKNAGYRIPEDIVVTGYHGGGRGPSLSGWSRPTSIEVDSELIGETAVHLMGFRSQQSIPSASSILLPARLVQGETTKQG
jgi:LacI family transcriptional regulator